MFKRYLLAGLLIWVPLVATIWVLSLFVNTLDQLLHWLPPPLHPKSWLGRDIPGSGVVLTLLILLATGLLATNFIGAKLLSWWERLLSRIPVVKSVYTSVKQVSDTLFSGNGQAFRQAVLVPYPHAGLLTVAFVVGKAEGDLARAMDDGDERVAVYVPTTPNPTSGFLLFAKKSDLIHLPFGIDEALKYVVSLGVVAPPKFPANRSSQAHGPV